ncbi:MULTISPECIES: restriction endonuclease subunit S [unclassified Halomonas]|uniref:restriction endonuclease subunit S n=1 Tax=unclassified Halomonas TaxID=2609666 RepID=UPI0009904628|nr:MULTISPECIES: restriction endonuclease subunit S [unclassified Halomonas]AQU81274.1 hypothetical protein B2G49_00775 [Halomonas sp. 'Soap Lake \
MKFKPLSELLEIPLRNGLTKPKKLRGSGVKMVNMGELFKYPRMTSIPMDRAPLTEKEADTSFLRTGDLLFARQSLVREGAGKCSIFLYDTEPVFFESHLIRCRLCAKKCNPLFYYYYFDSPAGKQAIDAIIEQGAGAAGIRGSDLAKLNVPSPSIDFQNNVVSILDAIDKKIETNHQINQTLEQMAQALFKSWFVNFEPVKAKIATLEAGGSAEDALLAAMQVISGKTANQLVTLSAEQPKHYAELRATAELFPSTMQDSELGEIPERWYPSRLDQNIELAYGKALKKSTRVEGKYPVYGSGGVAGSHNEFLVSGPGIIVGRKGTVGSIYWEPHNFYPIDTTFYVIVKNGYSLAFAYYLLQTLGLSEMNTDAAVPGLNRNNVYRLEVPSFPEPLISQFSQIITPLSEKISESNAESLTLTQLRDSLFPKLLSGQLTVSDVKGPRQEAEVSADV